MTEHDVASATEDAPNLAGLMVMIYALGAILALKEVGAYRASPSLGVNDALTISNGDAKSLP